MHNKVDHGQIWTIRVREDPVNHGVVFQDSGPPLMLPTSLLLLL